MDKLGFSDWFRTQVDEDQKLHHEIARVIAVHRDSFVISMGQGDVFAECSGNLLYTAESPLELPVTGDWVYADFYDDSLGIIHAVLPRKSLLKRKTPGRRVDFQVIGANIDTAFIMQSADLNFNLRRLERYLAMVREGDVNPVVLLSKCDLAGDEKVEELIASVRDIAPEIDLVPFSSITGENIDEIQNLLLPAKTYCLLGSSGVGKTTLMNAIIGEQQFATQEVSKRQGKGKHTTTSRELVILDGGALLIDTPGMRELGNLSIDSGIDETFAEIASLTEQCRFRDCTHTSEKGCAVLAAIHSGDLDENRFRNYQKMKSESTFYDMSYLEKRKKDKAFGKMVKSVMKGKKQRR